jgi:hypothetical protein
VYVRGCDGCPVDRLIISVDRFLLRVTADDCVPAEKSYFANRSIKSVGVFFGYGCSGCGEG